MKTVEQETILSIDAGTQSIRAALIDLKGNIISIAKTPIEAYFSKHPGWAEQEPDYYWKQLCITTGRLFQNSQIKNDAIKGVTLTTQRGTVINLDRKGNALRPAILWLDQRFASVEHWPGKTMTCILKSLKQYGVVEHVIRECESNWIQQNQPDLWDKTFKYLFVSGFFTYKLTGEYVDSAGNMVGYVPYNYKKQEWAGKSDLKWKMFPMDRSILPKLVRPSEIMGQITRRASKETGIPEGLPVIAAAADKACEVLGSGCMTPEIACLSYGTTATIETTNAKYVEIVPFMPPYTSAIPGWYNPEVQIFRGYWMVNWFKKEFGFREAQLASEKNVEIEELFDELIRDIDPGSNGLILQPYWSPGVRIPGPEAKGAIIGFGDVHTRAHMYRSILEGLAYALKEGSLRMEKRNRTKIKRLRISGGGSQSNAAMQLTADIFNLPAERPHTFETSCLGAAIDAAVGLGYYSDFESAVREMTKIKDVFEPEPESSKIYRELFERVYLKMYDRLKPLYEEIRNITGYPPGG